MALSPKPHRGGPSWPARPVGVAVLGIGIVLATGDLLGQRGQSTVATATPVRLSMAGLDPAVIAVTA